MYKRLFKFNNLYNVRDLGNYQAEDNKLTKKYKYLRSDGKGSLDEKELQYLFELGFKVVIDLRRNTTINDNPSPFNKLPNIKYYNISIVGEIKEIALKDIIDMSVFYIEILENFQNQIYQIFKIFLKHLDEGIIFHCTAGKDRTGIIAMLLLGLANVSEDDIIANYAESYKNNQKGSLFNNLPPDIKKLRYSKPIYLKKTLQYLERKYQTIPKYLQTIGLSTFELDLLKNNFLT